MDSIGLGGPIKHLDTAGNLGLSAVTVHPMGVPYLPMVGKKQVLNRTPVFTSHNAVFLALLLETPGFPGQPPSFRTDPIHFKVLEAWSGKALILYNLFCVIQPAVSASILGNRHY